MYHKYISLLIIFLVGGSFFSQTNAQTSVKGLVTDSITGEGLPFVSVFLKGSTQGTTTDADGYFAFVRPSKSATLGF